MPQVPADYRVLERSHRKPRTGAKRTSAANQNEVLTVSIRVRRRSGAPPLPDLTRLAATPHHDRQYHSREDFAAQYGASQEDLDKVAQFARAHGLSVVESSIPRRTVVLKGTVAQMNKAFVVDLGTYETADEKYRGREGPIHVPHAIYGIVEGVFGLDNRKMANPHIRSGMKSPAAVSPAEETAAMTPPRVAQLYRFPTPSDASGQTIGIFEFSGGYKPSDLKLFFDSLRLSVPAITPVGILGHANKPDASKYTTETLLDIGVAGSVAPGAKLAVYFAPWTEQGWVDVVTTAIHDTVNKPSVISISYGWPENDTINGLTWSLAAIDAVTTTFQEAAAMGVTILVSSGDTGSGCEVGDAKAHVQYPGSDPYVTCCGGTTLANVSGPEFAEDVWNTADGATGGGISDIICPPNFPLPAWQSAASVPGSINDGHNGRGVPDIAGNADRNSGYTLFQNGKNIGTVGGTSAAAPLYAGLAALMNAHLGKPVGYLNPTLYSVPYTQVFRDINDNRNNASGGASGYVSGPGWDGCTGLGSVDGTALENALRG